MLYRLSYMSAILPTLERVAGIEPAYSAWKADVLPLNYTRYLNIPYQAGIHPRHDTCSLIQHQSNTLINVTFYKLLEGGGLFGASPLTLRVAAEAALGAVSPPRRTVWFKSTPGTTPVPYSNSLINVPFS